MGMFFVTITQQTTHTSTMSLHLPRISLLSSFKASFIAEPSYERTVSSATSHHASLLPLSTPTHTFSSSSSSAHAFGTLQPPIKVVGIAYYCAVTAIVALLYLVFVTANYTTSLLITNQLVLSSNLDKVVGYGCIVWT